MGYIFFSNPEPPLEPPEVPPVATCYKCKGEIWNGEYYGMDEGGALCTDCLEDEWRDMSTPEKFDIMGYRVEGDGEF